ncbi:cyclophane-forming radical SAM/SPASM peptide maturase YhhB [Vibrio echinoideorum]|uniref:cyclophane-forming radical SAM/SPASM peptide maturase YhhB n=1 Tax=Vibrio echinoideorum TaxID=2100116 RepID=UPI00107FF5B8|nr:cyclophane-forming radical SAM/SPASM peptide maturase YhhB [Vibrio echinoideorum]
MPARLDTVLIKTASRCNLDCTYCYVYQGEDTSWKNQPKKMSKDTIDVLVDRLIEQSINQDVGFAIVLHGGEPLLIGFERMQYLLTSLRKNLNSLNYPISLQTNGVLLTNPFLDLFSEMKVSVSVSIDGDKIANDISRITRTGKSSFDDTVKGIKLLKSHHDNEFLFAGTLSVIQPNISPKDIYLFLKSLGTPSMDFLFQDGNYNKLPIGKYSFESTEYGQWMKGMLDMYLSDPEPVKIPCIDDILRLTMGGDSIKEGKGDSEFGILIVETDGEIRKNDTLRLSYDGADFFKTRDSVRDIDFQTVIDSEEFQYVSSMQKPTSDNCLNCSVKDICGGGMPLYRWSDENGYNNPSVFCNDHYYFIESVKNTLNTSGGSYVS